MGAMERRQFLQGLGTLSLGYVGFGTKVAWAAEQFGKTLRKNTSRKLALLIGINQYDARGEWLPLNGCITDVEMQRELLIHRFGFLPADILTLTDQQATRAAIAQAFSQHLISQTLVDDLVVVHFSGHGSQIGTQKTLLPVDSSFPAVGTPVLDFSLETIQLWLNAIASENVTCVIDAGYINPGAAILGNFRIRSRPSRADLQFGEEELALKGTLTEKFGSSENQNSNLILQVSDRYCADAIWQGFSSGVFTYALTQQLWQANPATSLIFSQVTSTLEQKAFAPIEKLGSAKANSTLKLTSNQSNSVGAILGATEDKKALETWLGGLPINVLADLAVGSVLVQTQSPTQNSGLNLGQKETRFQVRSRNGLKAKVEVLESGDSGITSNLIQEQIRILPKDLGLAIGLDSGLAKIERIDAQGAISDIPRMLGVNAGEEYADCIFGTESNSYGLFTVGHSQILGSFGAVSESVSAAIRRLRPKLEGLLAAKLIQFTGNKASSKLGLRVRLEARRGNESTPIVNVRQSSHVADQLEPLTDKDLNSTLVVGDRLLCYLENLTEEPLHIQIFSFDPRGKMVTPSFIIAPYANDGILSPKQTLIIPHPDAPIAWTVSAPRGLVNVQVIASRFPLIQSTNLREQYARQATSPTSMISVPNPLEVAQALLTDLTRSPESNVSTQNSWLLDVNDWATLGLTYHVA